MKQIVARSEAAPCPFCGAARLSEAPTMMRDTAVPGDDRERYVVSLAHTAKCPRHRTMIPVDVLLARSEAARRGPAHEPGASPGDAAAEEIAAMEDYILRRVPPGEDHVPRSTAPHDVRAACDVGKVEALATLIGQALKEALSRGKLGESPGELSAAILGVACSVAEAADPNFILPIFLMSFMPESGVTEPEALGLVRMIYAEHRRCEEDAVERTRIALEVEEIRRDEEERAREAN